MFRRLAGFAAGLMGAVPQAVHAADGARVVAVAGYSACVELTNATTRVVLEPNAGGRVLHYQLNGREVLFQDPSADGWTLGSPRLPAGLPAGRFDIGPEHGRPFNRDQLWEGRWTAEITGPRQGRLTSAVVSGVQLVRDFTLARDSSHLRVTQTIHNRGRETVRSFHWSRTFAEGGGICFAPLPTVSRFPKGYLLYGPGRVIDYMPADEPGTTVRDGLLIISAPPTRPKFALDVSPGWLAYLTRSGLLFVKKFPVYPDRVYGEPAANNVSIWYSGNRVTEIEPIGPLELIAPGASASFTEDWWLHALPYPADGAIDAAPVRRLVDASVPE
jgi:hypothetical protein